MTVHTSLAGRLPDGTPVHAHTLVASNRSPTLRVLELGATVDSLSVLDRDGRRRDVVLGLPSIADRVSSNAFHGSIVGRYANRLAGARFVVDGTWHTVPANEGANALHGGPDGFDGRVWRTVGTTETAVQLRLVSGAGDQGFPGDLTVEVTYQITGTSVSIDYRAVTTESTVVNLTNHSYFNLDGPSSDGIDDHILTVESDHYLPVGPDLIPTGEVRPVAGSPFDLTGPTRVGDRVRATDHQLLLTRGIDHHFVVRGEGMRSHARLVGPTSGIALTVVSEQPGVQVYTGNVLDGSAVGRYGRTYRQGAGIALETQHAPDSPNQPSFPSTLLRPGDTFRSTTLWEFHTEAARGQHVGGGDGNGRRRPTTRQTETDRTAEGSPAARET